MSSWPNWRGQKNIFWRRQGQGVKCEMILKNIWFVIKDWNVAPVVKFEITLPLFCYLLHPLTIIFSRVESSMIHFKESFEEMLKESSCNQGEVLIITYSFQKLMFQWIWSHINHALLESFLMIELHEPLKIIFHKHSFCPTMAWAEHWKKLTIHFSQIFYYIFRTTIL